MTTYHLVAKDRASLLSVALRREISEAELAAIRTVLRIHDHDDEAPCYCAWQFPDKCTLTMLWADAQRRANVPNPPPWSGGLAEAPYPGSARWVARQPGYLPAIQPTDSPAAVEAKVLADPDFRKPGERVNVVESVMLERTRQVSPHDPASCMFCDNDPEQCHADLDCQHRAWSDGYCFGHRKVAEAVQLKAVRPDTDRDHGMMIGNDTAD